MTETHFFLAESRKNVVSHKPATLCISAAHIATKKVVQYCAAVKISEYKIKRRANQTTDLEVVYVDSTSHKGIMTEEQADHNSDHISIRPNSNLRADATGFMVYVETQGGKTEGRQKQKYLLLRRNAPYVISSKRGVFVLNVCLKEPNGVLNLLNWSAKQKIQRFAGHTHHVIVPNAEAHTRVSYLATQIDFPVIAQGILVEAMDTSQDETKVKKEFKQKHSQDQKQFYPQSSMNKVFSAQALQINGASNHMDLNSPSTVKNLFYAQTLHNSQTKATTAHTQSQTQILNLSNNSMDTSNNTPPLRQRTLPASNQPFSSSATPIFNASLQPGSGDSPNTMFQASGGHNPANSFTGASLYNPKRRFFVHPSQANEFDASEQPPLTIASPIGEAAPARMEATPVCDTVDCGFNFCGEDDSALKDRQGPAPLNYSVPPLPQVAAPQTTQKRSQPSAIKVGVGQRHPQMLHHPLPPEQGQGMWFDKWVSKLLDF